MATEYITHLRPTNRIIRSPIFERTISKLQDGQESDLSANEADSVKKFLKLNSEDDDVDRDLSFAQRHLNEEAKRRRSVRDNYRSTIHVSPTSNSCERLFSAARLIMSYLQSGMDCNSRGMLLFFLKQLSFLVLGKSEASR
jgi:hypothetical protein